ncbi:unnamed protein product, partial [Didymodactylos carnosus]
MDVDPNKDDSDHGGFRPGAGRKRKKIPSSTQAMVDEEEHKLWSVNIRRNCNKHEEVYVELDGSLGQQLTDLFTSLPHFVTTTIMNRHAEGKATKVKHIQQAIADAY